MPGRDRYSIAEALGRVSLPDLKGHRSRTDLTQTGGGGGAESDQEVHSPATYISIFLYWVAWGQSGRSGERDGGNQWHRFGREGVRSNRVVKSEVLKGELGVRAGGIASFREK